MFDTILDAVIDTAKVFIVVYLIYCLVELFENKFSKKIASGDKRWSPLSGAGVGLIPQCGFGVVATDLYSKRHITMGTLIAIYISTSDEALPILLSSPDKFWVALPLFLLKFVIACLVGYLVDGVMARRASKVFAHADNCEEDSHHGEEHIGCCHHHIEAGGQGHWAKTYLLHPLIHSLKISAYILLFNLIFGFLVYFIGEDAITGFLQESGAFAPLFAVLVGLIPNCVSSVVITNLYITAGLSFGATLGGLIVNAGISFVFLFKQNKNKKENFAILSIVTVVGLLAGYIFHFIV